jgi:hypothetical protein
MQGRLGETPGPASSVAQEIGTHVAHDSSRVKCDLAYPIHGGLAGIYWRAKAHWWHSVFRFVMPPRQDMQATEISIERFKTNIKLKILDCQKLIV